MSKGQPSNAVLLEKLDRMGLDIGEIKDHLKMLNGSVASNKAKLDKQDVINKGIYAVGGALLTIITAMVINIL